jgi:DNA polymerase V
MKLIKGEFTEKLDLLFAPSIRAGFPSPAEDYLSDSLDFNRDLIKHPEATFYGQVEGDSMINAGICDGDIAVIDRSLEAEHGDVVVGYIDKEFTVKYLDLTHKKDGWIELRPANESFKPIRIDEDSNFRVWGVVIYTIKKWK